MCSFEGHSYLLDHLARLWVTEVDRSAHCTSTHVPSLVYRAVRALVEGVRSAQEFIVVDFYHEWNFMCPFTCNCCQYTVGRSYRVTSSINSHFDDVFRIEEHWVWSK